MFYITRATTEASAIALTIRRPSPPHRPLHLDGCSGTSRRGQRKRCARTRDTRRPATSVLLRRTRHMCHMSHVTTLTFKSFASSIFRVASGITFSPESGVTQGGKWLYLHEGKNEQLGCSHKSQGMALAATNNSRARSCHLIPDGGTRGGERK